MDNLSNSNTLRGTLIMLAGLILLLHTLGLIDIGISLILIVLAIAAIAYGAYTSGLYDTVYGYFFKK